MGTAVIVWRKHYLKRGKPPKKMRTICEVLRELHRDATERGDTLSMHKLEECHDMAKRMQYKLFELQPDKMRKDIMTKANGNRAAFTHDE